MSRRADRRRIRLLEGGSRPSARLRAARAAEVGGPALSTCRGGARGGRVTDAQAATTPAAETTASGYGPSQREQFGGLRRRRRRASRCWPRSAPPRPARPGCSERQQIVGQPARGRAVAGQRQRVGQACVGDRRTGLGGGAVEAGGARRGGRWCRSASSASASARSGSRIPCSASRSARSVDSVAFGLSAKQPDLEVVVAGGADDLGEALVQRPQKGLAVRWRDEAGGPGVVDQTRALGAVDAEGRGDVVGAEFGAQRRDQQGVQDAVGRGGAAGRRGRPGWPRDGRTGRLSAPATPTASTAAWTRNGRPAVAAANDRTSSTGGVEPSCFGCDTGDLGRCQRARATRGRSAVPPRSSGP